MLKVAVGFYYPTAYLCQQIKLKKIILSIRLKCMKKQSNNNAAKLKKAGVTGFNKPKATPNHPTKSHIVVAKEGDKTKTIRFGQAGVSGSPAKKGESDSEEARRKAFKARHAENIAKGKMSAAYWADKVKW